MCSNLPVLTVLTDLDINFLTVKKKNSKKNFYTRKLKIKLIYEDNILRKQTEK